MASRAERIMQALVQGLTVPAMATVPASAVFRDLTRGLSAGLPLAIVIEEGDEADPATRVLGRADRSLSVRLIVVARGLAPYALADAPMVEAYGRVMADLQLGGLAYDIEEGAVKRERDSLETDVAAVSRMFRVSYRTDTYSLE